MPQHIRADALHVLGSHVATAVQERVGASGEGEIDRRTRRSAVADQTIELQIVGARIARSPNDIDDIILHAIIDIDAVHDRAGVNDVLRIDDRPHLQIRRRRRH